MTEPRLPYYRAPAGLEARVRAALRAPGRPDYVEKHLVHRVQFWRSLALATSFTLATVVAVPIIRDWRAAQNTALVDAHARALMAGHLVDVASSEHHTVKPWFAGKLAFSPPVPDLSADSFSLIGGRVDRVAGRDVAVVVYGRGKHTVDVFVWPAGGGGSAPQLRTIRGINIMAWSSGDLRIAAVSDLNAEELRPLAQLFH